MSNSAAASSNLSDVLGNIGNTEIDSGSSGTASATAQPTTGSGSSPASNTATATRGSSAPASTGSNTLTDAPNLGTSTASSRVSTLTGAPALTSGDSVAHLPDLPTLSGYYSYPPASVPPTAGAPYMQRTNLPENFVFIVVGAVIAFVALVIIAWRVVTSWSINRRFRRHEGSAPAGNTLKASYTPLADFKQKPSGGAQGGHDMKDLGTLPRNFSSVPSLFFSPTAEVAQRNSMRPVSRDPSGQMHLPAGHYRDSSRN